MASGLGKLLQMVKPRVPDKLKGGRIEKIGKYFYNIYSDYKTVAKETVQDCKDSPVKASIYISLLTIMGVLYKTNPSEREFKEQLMEDAHELLLISEPIRNANTDKYICSLLEAQRDDRLRYYNLLLFSIIHIDTFSKDTDVYEARCNLVKPHWKDFHKSIVEVGILKQFINLKKAMVDYDVNMDEWDEHGMPTNPVKIASLV